MATENPMRIMEGSRTGKWASSRGSASFTPPVSSVLAADELGILRRDHTVHRDQSSIAPGRSGSAPPSMEGSFATFGNLVNQHNSSLAVPSSGLENYVSADQLQADPSYPATYHSNIDLQERFFPSAISRESIHLAQSSGISGNSWRLPSEDGSGSGSLYAARKSLSTHEEEPEDDRVESSGIMIGQNTLSFTGRHKSLVDLIQEDFPRTPSPIFSQTHSSSHVEEPFNHDGRSLSLDSLSLNTSKSPEPNSGRGYRDTIEISHGSTAIQDPSAVSDPLSPQKDEITSNDGCSTSVLVGGDTIISDGSENLNKDEGGQDNQQLGFDQQNELHPQISYSRHNAGYHVPGSQKQGTGFGANNNGMDKVSHGHLNMTSVEMQPLLHASGVHPPLYSTAAAYMASGSSYYPNFSASGLYAPHYSGYALSSSFVPPYLTGYPPQTGFPLHFNANSGSGQSVGSPTGEGISKGSIMQNSDRFYGHHGMAMHPSFTDPLSMRYFQQLVQDPYSVPMQYSHYPPPGMIGSHVDSFALRNDPTAAAYSGDQKFQLPPSGSISISSPREFGLPSSNYLSSPTGLGFVPQSPLGSPVMPGSPIAGTGRRYNSGFSQTSPRNFGGYAKWQGQRGVDSINDHRKHSFLEELKGSGAQRIDLPDIIGRIVEFSIDQHGSRFIQQKLENCSVEEKESVFKEILPHAPKLITDVFGNYVIQKFFEHGSYEQRKELASQLSGQMVPLSLQMYGCRVIQKALEVIDLEQKTKLVLELDGHVIRCVRDQNGNHVIQKCIECLPTAKIDFIISAFEGQVAMLSTHPYGCRVIQRVLEHCSDDLQCRSIVSEILGSTNDLAQDQYGNYVIQHVLERGKAFERSQIISKLSGKIVQMSQHKYASNVVEKCLEFCDVSERELLIEEILMQSDDLLAMMKDQFANYVVQKILDIGNNRQRETLFNHIRIHLDALKKYTYGKHIVTRFEQLSGEGNGTSDP